MRFDYVKFNEQSQALQQEFKVLMQHAERIANALPDSRARALALTKLEEAYCWIGKAIRDNQIQSRGAELQEGRGNE